MTKGVIRHRRANILKNRYLYISMICSITSFEPALAQSSMRKFLEGRWVGDGLQIRVDQDAVQANDNPEKPFEWQPFNILNITGSMIVFQIGARRYIGLINGQQMTITISGARGSYIINKLPPEVNR